MQFDPNSEFIEIGDHMAHRGVGDVLTLTSVIREVNQKYPARKIVVKTLGDKSCFLHNPRIHEIKNELLDHPIDAPIPGHYILKKCSFFGIQDPSYRNELFISEEEGAEARSLIKELSGDRSVILFAPNSSDRRRDWTVDGWNALLEAVSEKYDVYQVDRQTHNSEDAKRGIFPEGKPEDIEPERTFLQARQELRGVDWRKAMALMKVSGKYLGTNTGFLPMANAFGSEHFVFHDTRFVNPSEWEYPDNINFYETNRIETVIRHIKNHWLG